jgi:hypothetical protein
MREERSIIIYDTEFWTDTGVWERRWRGLSDFPPLLMQIGAYKVLLESDWPIVGEFFDYILPIDQFGIEAPVTEYFTKLTGISESIIRSRGCQLSDAIANFSDFTGDHLMYCYGNDIIATILPSCYLRSIKCPFKPNQALDIRHVLFRAGISAEDLYSNSSGTLARLLGAYVQPGLQHDALADAASIVAGIRWLHEAGRLPPEWLLRPAVPDRSGRAAATQ